ncbi:MAG TPA: type II secretion system F family protein [Nocardioidaceae bacterium]|nr:type II secretion system F family protein [Nocardioidaceae bacterium]
MSSASGILPSLVAAGLAAGASALALTSGVGRSSALAELAGADPDVRAAGPQPPDRDDLLGRNRLGVSLLAGLAPVLLVGGALGVVAGLVVAVFAHRILGSREPAPVRRRREAVARSLPLVVDLLAVTLASGASPSVALSTVAAAVEGPVAEDLAAAEHSLRLGRDPARVWREVAQRPGLSALGRSMARALETGASVRESLHRLAEDLDATVRLEAESRAMAVGVRAAAPLGLCLLPAFILLGVVPLVAGSVVSLLNS